MCQSPGNPLLFPVVREKPDRRRKRERASINKYNDTLHIKDDDDALADERERERESTLSALDYCKRIKRDELSFVCHTKKGEKNIT